MAKPAFEDGANDLMRMLQGHPKAARHHKAEECKAELAFLEEQMQALTVSTFKLLKILYFYSRKLTRLRMKHPLSIRVLSNKKE